METVTLNSSELRVSCLDWVRARQVYSGVQPSYLPWHAHTHGEINMTPASQGVGKIRLGSPGKRTRHGFLDTRAAILGLGHFVI